jgi:DeoR/GlpR family transcriptional regulator of sugar metabolism
MKAHAETTVLLADSGKFGRVGFISVLPLSAMDLIITDSALDKAAAEELSGAGINIEVLSNAKI